MTSLQPWAIAFIVLASSFVGLYFLWRIVLLLAPRWYRSMVENNAVSVDDFVGGPPEPASAFKSWLLNWLNVKNRVAKKVGYPLKTQDSDKIQGLKVTMRNESGESESQAGNNKKPPVVVGTIRMGFGHHRIAYAATSWGIGSGSGNDRETWCAILLTFLYSPFPSPYDSHRLLH